MDALIESNHFAHVWDRKPVQRNLISNAVRRNDVQIVSHNLCIYFILFYFILSRGAQYSQDQHKSNNNKWDCVFL